MGANASHEPLGELSRHVPKATQGGFTPSQVRRSIRKSLRKRRDKRKLKDNTDKDSTKDPANPQVEGPTDAHSRKMDKLKRTLSLKKKKEQYIPEAAKPHVWQTDESTVRAGTCNFSVKYLGCVEVFESRGMQVCEEALKVLRTNRRRPTRGILYVSGDGLRVVDDDTKGLIVDQTIEKVSFCAPDRNHERGFSYICRDGTTRRWMCHGFVAARETGERLSHAVGCAFAACLERKQKRDQDSGVTMTFDQNTSTFTRLGSFRQMTVTERLSDPQECKPNDATVPLKKVENPHAIARPHATPQLIQRQGSFRVFTHLNQSSPFKRQLSLRLNDLPSNLERTRSLNLDNCPPTENSNITNNNTSSSQPIVAPIPETAPVSDNARPNVPDPRADAVSEMCQQVSAGLSLLSSFSNEPFAQEHSSGSTSLPPMNNDVADLLQEGIDWSSSATSTDPAADVLSNPDLPAGMSKGEEWLAQLHSEPLSLQNPASRGPSAPPRRNPSLHQLRSVSLGAAPTNGSPTFPEPPKSNLTNGPKRTYTKDPFDADWVSVSSQNANPNNPFLQSVTKAFEVQM